MDTLPEDLDDLDDENEEKDEPRLADKFTWTNTAIVLLLYTALYAVYGLIVFRWNSPYDAAGVFGDMYGGFNAFAAGIAMLGVIGAILLQWDQNRMQAKELMLQRKELKLTRTELKGQRRALEAQNTHTRRAAEAAIMTQLMTDYDGLRDAVQELQRFYFEYQLREHAFNAFRNGRRAPNQNNDITERYDPARFRISRFFVRVRKLSLGGYISKEIVFRALGRSAIEDVFLELVDPLDQVVNELAGRSASVADRNFYTKLLEEFILPLPGKS